MPDINQIVRDNCLKHERYAKVFRGLGKIWDIYSKETDPKDMPEIMGEIVGPLILLQTDENHSLDNKTEES